MNTMAYFAIVSIGLQGGQEQNLRRVDDDRRVQRRVALHPAKDLGIVMTGALEPGVSRDGRDDGRGGGEDALHF
jgi:hypothetical protein